MIFVGAFTFQITLVAGNLESFHFKVVSCHSSLLCIKNHSNCSLSIVVMINLIVLIVE